MFRVARLMWFCLAVAVGGCSTIVEDPTKDWTPERFYNEATFALAEGQWSIAINYFEQLESRFPYGSYTEQGQLGAAYAHYKNDDAASALATADRFIRMYPTHANVDYAYYLKGLANFNGSHNLLFALIGKEDDLSDRDLRSKQESYSAFRELIDRFPQSQYAKDAAQRMTYLVHAQARYEIKVAQYYFDRGAFIAAVNRSKYAIENYPRTPAVEDALGIQALSYQRLGLTKLADDTARVLRQNFPQSRYLAELSNSRS